jgi:DNA-binding NarL/FixJ family response regulator
MNVPEPTIRVVCIDDHPLILAGVEAILEAEPGMAFAGGTTSAAAGLELYRRCTPDIALVDLRLPDMEGSALISSILQEFAGARLIALTTYKGDACIQRALGAGARGYLLKDLMYKELVEAIRKVQSGERYIMPVAACELASHVPRMELTTRELEVLRLVADGNRNKEIARLLRVTEDTVKFHIKSILGKLDVNDRTHAVTVAIKRGMLHVD